MRTHRAVACLLPLAAGLASFLNAVPGWAEDFAMQLPPSPVFTYRVTAGNQLIKPAPIPLRFSRNDGGMFCSKVVQVGVNTGSKANFPGGEAPGSSDAGARIFTSAISGGGGALCSFNFNDNLVALPVPDHMDNYVTDTLKGSCLASPPFVDPGAHTSLSPANTPWRRKAGVAVRNNVTFKVFLKKNGGEHEWRAPLPCDPKTPQFCKIPVEAICEAVPNRAPLAESFALAPEAMAAGGGPVKITLIGADDVGVGAVFASVYSGTVKLASLPLVRSAGLGRNAAGENRSQWESSYNVPANPASSARSLAFTLELRDGEGAVTNLAGAAAKTLQQAGAQDTVAPQILGMTLTPQEMTSAAGEVSAVVRAADNVGVASVLLTLTKPDGQKSSLYMAQSSGTAASGEWRSNWTLWANTGSQPQVYGVLFTVKDAAGNAVSSPPGSITVAAQQPVPARPQFQAPAKPGPIQRPMPVR